MSSISYPNNHHNNDDGGQGLAWCARCDFPVEMCQCATIATDAAGAIKASDNASDSNDEAVNKSGSAWWLALGESPSHAAISAVFYAICLAGAVFGQILVGTSLLFLPLWFALILALAIEVAAIKFAIDAAVARLAGEHAIVPQLVSYTVAVIAVGVNVIGHVLMSDYFGAAIYGLFSALAFVAFTIRSEFRRRQADRAAGRAAHTTPNYGLRRWVSDHAVTARAKQLAQADPRLGLYGSLETAARQLKDEKRRSELAALLRSKALNDFDGDKLLAGIDVATYDLNVIANQLCKRADHTAAVEAIEADLKRHHTGANPTTADSPQPAGAVATKPQPAKSKTKTRKTKSAKATRTDAQLLDVLAGVERNDDGTVPVRRAARALECGPDRARRLLTEAGLLKPQT